jgi:glycine/D-amino acid oxidase-like deaminating enzyme
VVTKRKDLRTGRSIWESQRAPGVPHGPLVRDIAADVLGVGAGITGALVADALATCGLKVAIVDRRGPAKGSTTASTALVQYEIDTPLTTLVRKIGKADAIRAWRRSRLAVETLAARVTELGVPDVVRRNTLFLSGEELGKAALEREHAARQAAGLATRFLDRRALGDRFGIARQAALLTYGDLVLDPRKTTLALLKAAAAHGARTFAPVEIMDLDAKRGGVIAVASNGKRIHCRYLVFATGYELPNQVPRKGHRIVSTWAIATVAQPRRLWPEQCMIWEASNPYLYLRTTPHGHVICGGEDEEFSDESARDALLRSKTMTLRRKLKRLLPMLDDTVEFAWTGAFRQTRTGLPTIGRIRALRNCWVALGYGGNGITYAQIAADVIAGALSGRPDIDADLYDFPRMP